MDHKNYFVQPVEASHRRYEALRAVIVDEQPMKEVADRFGISYGTVRNWASDFRRQRDAGQFPPFSLRHRVDGHQPVDSRLTINIPTHRSPMFGRCLWRPDAGSSLDTQGCSCSCPCWHNCGLTAWSQRPITRARKWCRPPTPC